MAKTNSKDSSNEERLAASNYIVTFYNQVIQLTSLSSQYHNLLLLFSNKYGSLGKGMEDIDREALKDSVQNIRYVVQTVYIQLSSLNDKVKVDEKEKEELDNLYKSIKNEFIIKREDLEKFVILLNKFLMNNIMKNLLQNSNDFVNNFVN